MQPQAGTTRVALDNCASPAASWTVIQATPPPPPPPSGGLATWEIVGIVIGGLAGLILIAVGIAYFIHRNNLKKETAAQEALEQEKLRQDALEAQNDARAQGFVQAQSAPNNVVAGTVPYNVPPPDYAGAQAAAAIPLLALSTQQQAQGGYSTANGSLPGTPVPGSATQSFGVPSPPATPLASPPTAQSFPTSVASPAVSIVAGTDISAYQGSQCTATRPYNAKFADELELRPGDVVLCEKVHEDGWGQVRSICAAAL